LFLVFGTLIFFASEFCGWIWFVAWFTFCFSLHFCTRILVISLCLFRFR
jgi:hypothetical protein